MPDYPRPTWRPTVGPTPQWTLDRLRAYLSGKRFTAFENGTCVVWPQSAVLSEDECIERLRAVVTHEPDLKVRAHSGGDFLVTFKGGVGGVMSGEILRNNLAVFKREAYAGGRLPSEKLISGDGAQVDDLHMIAGLYVRARLYMDVEHPVVQGIV
jgi:hypothetical protein